MVKVPVGMGTRLENLQKWDRAVKGVSGKRWALLEDLHEWKGAIKRVGGSRWVCSENLQEWAGVVKCVRRRRRIYKTKLFVGKLCPEQGFKMNNAYKSPVMRAQLYQAVHNTKRSPRVDTHEII